jgi:hypothetical protein
MNDQETHEGDIVYDTACAAAVIIVEEFFAHCPNGIGQAVHARLCEIVGAAIQSACWEMHQRTTKPRLN